MVRVRTSRRCVLGRTSDLLPLCVRSKVTKTQRTSGPAYFLATSTTLITWLGRYRPAGTCSLRTLGLVRSMVMLGKCCFEWRKVTIAIADACESLYKRPTAKCADYIFQSHSHSKILKGSCR